jgi:uncharacterized protein YecT (DUF1311 family)
LFLFFKKENFLHHKGVSALRRVILLSFIILSHTSAALAADCSKAADQSTMNSCANQAYKKSDRALNDIYNQIQHRLKDDPGTGKKLTAAQKAWIQFRDSECNFAASGVAGGSIAPMIQSECADSLTQDRIKQLKTYLNCQEGDTSCPVPPG